MFAFDLELAPGSPTRPRRLTGIHYVHAARLWPDGQFCLLKMKRRAPCARRLAGAKNLLLILGRRGLRGVRLAL